KRCQRCALRVDAYQCASEMGAASRLEAAQCERPTPAELTRDTMGECSSPGSDVSPTWCANGARPCRKDAGMASNAATGTEVEALKREAILKSAVAAIVTIDSHGRIGTVNPAAERMFGYAAVELVGRNINLLMPEPYRNQHDTYLAKYLATGRRKIIGIGR